MDLDLKPVVTSPDSVEAINARGTFHKNLKRKAKRFVKKFLSEKKIRISPKELNLQDVLQ